MRDSLVQRLYCLAVPLFCIALVILVCCKEKSQIPDETTNIEVDSAKEFYEQPESNQDYTYAQFSGVYDHESTALGFTAILTISENGNDLSFTLSISQANGCKGEANGTVLMMSHESNYYVGFYQLENCRLQFSFLLQEDKIDIKEINSCKLHESNCTFEGTYAKRQI